MREQREIRPSSEPRAVKKPGGFGIAVMLRASNHSLAIAGIENSRSPPLRINDPRRSQDGSKLSTARRCCVASRWPAVHVGVSSCSFAFDLLRR